MLSAIQKLYRIERHAREAGMSFDERYRLRQTYALPVLREIKTWLNQQLPIAGSHAGAKRAAVIYTMVANAKLHGVEPLAYLKDVLSRIADYPYKQLADLLPQNWTKNALQK